VYFIEDANKSNQKMHSLYGKYSNKYILYERGLVEYTMMNGELLTFQTMVLTKGISYPEEEARKEWQRMKEAGFVEKKKDLL
jgi:predicted membrane-bound dolichyl-phosphate-mannose-protein mannosyltransferase